MNLGFMTKFSPEIVAFADGNGFNCLEVYIGKDGFGMDIDTVTDAEINEFLSVMDEYGMSVATVYSKVNHLDPDPDQRARNNRYFEKLIRMSRRLGTDIVTTCARGDSDKSPADNLPEYKRVFSRYASIAEDAGVKIALENCPHASGYPVRIGNMGYSPEMWEAMFDAVSSEAIGLEYDPSHLYWLEIDYITAIRDFGSRIYAFHAKDAEFLPCRGRCGLYGRQFPAGRSWRYRLPGWGGVDWREVFKALYDAGYAGPVLIENEDPLFSGDRRNEGLLKARDFLKPWMI